jgi:hypothetical protein
MWVDATAIRAIGIHINGLFIFFKISILLYFWHTHFFSVPCLATPTNAIRVDDAGSGATASWVFTHRISFINNNVSAYFIENGFVISEE